MRTDDRRQPARTLSMTTTSKQQGLGFGRWKRMSGCRLGIREECGTFSSPYRGQELTSSPQVLNALISRPQRNNDDFTAPNIPCTLHLSIAAINCQANYHVFIAPEKLLSFCSEFVTSFLPRNFIDNRSNRAILLTPF